MAIDDSELRPLAAEFQKTFYIPSSIRSLTDPIDEVCREASTTLAGIGRAFCANIQSIVSAAGIPYTISITGAHQRRYQAFYHAAQLQAVLDGIDTAEQGAFARNDAAKRAEDLGGSEEGAKELNYETCRFLLELAKNSDVADAAAQLTLQGTVLAWGAFEMLSRDLFRAYLNENPTVYTFLLADSDLRKRFELTRVSIERVADFAFDLSRTMGDLLVEQNDLADLGGIKAVYKALFPHDDALRVALSDRLLWVLFQRRSVIVHRQAIVDQRYIAISGDDTQANGTRLSVGPEELKQYLRVAAQAAHRLLVAARGNVATSGPTFAPHKNV